MNDHAHTRRETVASRIENIYVRALVVESDIIHQQAARDSLRRFKCQVDVAGDLQLAVALSQIVRYHMIFVEGALLASLGDTGPLRDLEVDGRCISVIAILGNSAPGATHRPATLGANDVISRPLASRRMESVIETWLNRGPVGIAHRV